MEKFIEKLHMVTDLLVEFVSFIMVSLLGLFLVFGVPILILLSCIGII